MNYNTKIWKWLVIVLVAVNLFVLITIWMKPHREHGPHGFPTPPIGMGGPKEMLVHELNLNSAQISAFDKLVDEHRAAINKLREEGKTLRHSLFDLLKTETTDSVKLKETTSAIGNNQIAIENATFEHFQKLRKLCDEGQKKKFDEIIDRVTQMMAGPQPGPPHP